MHKLPKVKNLELEISNSWLTIWLNSPENRNAISNDMIDDFNNVFDTIMNNRSIRGITFRGKDGVFCSGVDLKEIKSIIDNNTIKEDAIDLSVKLGKFFYRVNTLPQVTIMIIEGAAMAGGLGLASTGDIVITYGDAKFSLTETMIGLTPAQISPYIISRVGHTIGKRLMLTAARFSGLEAFKIGIADFLVTKSAELKEQENKIKSQVLKCAPGAIAETKRLIEATQSKPITDFINLASENFSSQLDTEGKEGILSFLEKRKPNWNNE